MDKILVIIPVVNLWDQYTIHCMESLYMSHWSVPFDVLIIDNGSTDQTVEKAKDFEQRKMEGRVHVIHNDSNIGVAGAWNQGVRWGIEHDFTHFVIANNDILVGPFTIENLYIRMRQGGVLLVSALDIAREVFVPQDVLELTHAVNHKEPSEAPHPCFSLFMITKKTIETVGWFDEIFWPAYHEDHSYHYRCKLIAGDNAAIATTTAPFYHYGSRTQNQAAGAAVVPGGQFDKLREEYRRMWGGTPGYEQFRHPYNNVANTPRKNEKQEWDIMGG